ncbi:hypothetical protein A2Y99_03580 [Candidatus Gottesmanbacteria bacterium RBG_13_37_7]|uniref:Glutamate/phenylalanine/leucine/valine/L-tryptophan dehydrogenase C-terminal domain-containing protein n=1 Tax=Candidatus Gottesmanbacteria bacterium RBG_13_37_7 TaxID=1798369 RepID=A0A1F5YJB5_9BACT|nr:MAG: hypothetical protein A2Y99_03580 [Candidatus Gottesmanbacteria bacterium RBG_13_37_7]
MQHSELGFYGNEGDQFESYLGEKELPVRKSTDLLYKLASINTPEAKALHDNLKVFRHLELEKEGSSRRDVVLMEDINGKKSMLTVCRDLDTTQEGNFDKFIGGLGVYPTKEGRVPIEYALEHTKLLSVIMRRKCEMAGIQWGGAKGTVLGESDWLKSEILQVVTGFLFSQKGIFTDTITGSDVGQTPDTIANMAIGSHIGGDHQIAGMIEALDTPASCRVSLDETEKFLRKMYENEETYAILRRRYGDEKIPDLSESTVLVEGFGRIGRTAVRLWLDKGAKKVIISDPFLTEENDKLPKLKTPEHFRERDKTRVFMMNKYLDLEEKYGDRVSLVPTDDLVKQKAGIFCPCSSKEGMLDIAKIDQLDRAGVRVIIAGGNNIFGQDSVWEMARYAAGKHIVVIPEILSNCGSVTAASMEPELRELMYNDDILNELTARLHPVVSQVQREKIWELIYGRQQETAAQFVQDRLIPHIRENTEAKIKLLIEKMIEFKKYGVDLYTAGEIAFREKHGPPIEFTGEGILKN